MTDYATIKPIVAGDPARLLAALGVKAGARGRYWCWSCQSDGKPHRTPDVGLRTDGGGWACHKCGATGDWVKLVRELCRVGFREAVEYIAGVYGLRDMADIGRVQAEQRKAQAARRRERRAYPTLADAIETVRYVLGKDGKGVWNVVGIWEYSPNLYQTRFQRGADKEYRPIHKTARGWVIGAPPKPWPLWGIAEALA